MNDTQTLSPLLLTSRQTAKVLNISERSLATYTKSGDIPVIRIGSSVRYSPDELRTWIREHSGKNSQKNPNLALDRVPSAH